MITTYTNVLLLHYNNYFNRTIKKLDAVTDYMDADTDNPGTAQAVTHYADCSNINFVPSDGINTSLILGFSTNPTINNNYDYCVVYEYIDDDEQHTITRNVISRWFVIDMERTRDGQYEISLKRDVIADNLDTVLDATTYIEKGEVPVGNNLLFNKEGMLFNQIKRQEEQLRDASNCAWLVAYISKGWADDSILINYNPAEQNFEDVSAANITAWLSQ